MGRREPDPCTFVIFGATGDLCRRKLLPAVGRLTAQGLLHPKTRILGVARDLDVDDAAFRKLARASMGAAGVEAEAAESLASRAHYQTIGEATPEDYRAIAARITGIEAEAGLPPNRAYYLSLPPQAFGPTAVGLGEAGVATCDGFTRLVVEKPFGRDLQSARELNATLHRHFDESQIYRIDHYLGKETVQNLLVFRFANAIFESMWNRERVASVQIVVGESLGVGTRAGYYDQAGALRDMVQNHLTQLLSLVAMEVPANFSAEAIRYEKIKVLRSLAPLRREEVVYGQYVAGSIGGEAVPGYQQEPGVAPGSETETFVAMRVGIDSWRWQGVPFYLRTGKRFPRRTTTIAIRFRDVPVHLFESMGGKELDTADVLLITLQPDEGFSLHFDVKMPGAPFRLKRIPLSFRYSELVDELPEAYETLIHDVLTGDQTLFVHADEVDASWTFYAPLLEQPARPVRPYFAGTWGPPEADALAIPEADLWQEA